MNDWDRYSTMMRLEAADQELKRDPRRERKRVGGNAPIDLLVTLGIVIVLGIPVALIVLGVI